MASIERIDSAAWAGAVGAGIAASGAISVLQGKLSNGQISRELMTRKAVDVHE